MDRRLTGDHRHDPTIAECYRRQGKPARALDLLAELKRSDVSTKSWVDAQIARARSLKDTGRADTAFTLLKDAARDAGLVEELYRFQGRSDRGIRFLADLYAQYSRLRSFRALPG